MIKSYAPSISYAAPTVLKSYEPAVSYAASAPVIKSYAPAISYAAPTVVKSYAAPIAVAAPVIKAAAPATSYSHFSSVRCCIYRESLNHMSSSSESLNSDWIVNQVS